MRFSLTLLLCLIGSSALADAPAGYPFQSFDKAMQQAAVEKKPLFVYFGRYGCGYCEKTNKEAFSSDKVRDVYTSHYILAYVDAESGKRLRLPSGERVTEREVGTRYNAFVTPVFTFLTASGESLHRLVGVQRIEDLLAADKAVQKKLEGMPGP
jgi:thioredoxin-related protein